MRRPSARLAVPAAAAVGLTGLVVVTGPGATASPALPERSAAQLLVDLGERVQQPSPVQGSATVVSDLGLPALPGEGGGDLGPQSLLAGETEVRLWSDGAERSRVALVGDLAEWSVLSDGSSVWTWSSDGGSASRVDVPADAGAGADEEAAPALPAGTTPLEAARSALASVDETTEVTVDRTTTVAGRPAYTLVLTPRDDATLVGSVRLAVDAETSSPLAASVLAAGAREPAWSVAFDDVSFDAPGDGVFTPPADAVTVPLPDGDALAGGDARERLAALPEPQVVGEGWSAVSVLPGVPGGLPEPGAGVGTVPQDSAPAAPEDPAAGGPGDGDAGASEADPLQTLAALTTRVEGGRALQTALVSVLLTDDGRALVGAVDVGTLQEAAAAAPGSA